MAFLAAFEAALARGAPLLLDGAMGTMLAAANEAAPLAYRVPEELNELAPQRVVAVHHAYVHAGAQIIETNSFGGSPAKLGVAGLEGRAYALNVAAAHLARLVADAAHHPVWVAGSIGPTGAFLEPLGDLTFDAARAAFAAQAAALRDGGADLLLVETMTDLQEALAALAGASESGLPVAVTLTFEPHGRTMMGVGAEDAARALADAGALAVGANCGEGPAAVLPVVERMARACPGLPLVAQPNAGRPELVDGRAVYRCDPAQFAAEAPALVAAGVRLLGSCCGSTPEFTAALAATLGAVPEPV